MNYYDMYDQYDYSSPYMESTLIGIIMIIFIVMLVCAIFGLASYILRGVGMYTMAKRQGMDYAWLAFVPFARTYLHGELAGSIRLKHKSIQNPGIWLLALPFLYGAVSSLLNGIIWFVGFGSITKAFQYAFLPYGRMDISAGAVMGMIILLVITMVISIAYTAVYKSFEVLVNHQILERFTSKNMSIAHAVLSTLVPLYESICFFAMRNHPFNPGMEPPTPTPFMQSPPPANYYGAPVPPVPPMGGGYEESVVTPPVQENYAAGDNPTPFGNYGDPFRTPASGNTGSILDNPDSGNAGNILEPLDSGSFGTDKEPSALSDEKSEAPADAESTSTVNFTLPENEKKDNDI